MVHLDSRFSLGLSLGLLTRAKRSYRGTSLILVGLLAAVSLFIHSRQRPAKTEAAVTVAAPSADSLKGSIGTHQQCGIATNLMVDPLTYGEMG